MAKNIVVCCDGTGNEVSGNLSNVLKLFKVAQKNEQQVVFYQAGVGTLAVDDAWQRLKQKAKAVFALATGYGLDAEIASGYQFICENWYRGDQIYLFGFSRGAYAARAIAGFIHTIGLLPRAQLNLLGYALTAYKRSSERNDLSIAWEFGRTVSAQPAKIHFLGVWDTVASIITPRKDRFFPTLLTLPFTRRNPSVEIFRHAISIDECRRMFRLNRWQPQQQFVDNPFDKNTKAVSQDIKQVWFAGVHSDVGGGYPESESGISKFPLGWMIDEAVGAGLSINSRSRNAIVFGKQNSNSRHVYSIPESNARLHRSLVGAWKILEILPKSAKWRERKEKHHFWFYFPLGERRNMTVDEDAPLIHESVVDRMTNHGYNPANLPTRYRVEPWLSNRSA